MGKAFDKLNKQLSKYLHETESILLSAKEAKLNSGVYFLIMDSCIVYVGQSKNIHSRISTHIKNPDKIFDSFSYIKCPIQYLDTVEKYYITKFRPIYNQTNKKRDSYFWSMHRSTTNPGPYGNYTICAIYNKRYPNNYIHLFCSEFPKTWFDKIIKDSSNKWRYKEKRPIFNTWLYYQILSGETFGYCEIGSYTGVKNNRHKLDIFIHEFGDVAAHNLINKGQPRHNALINHFKRQIDG